MSDQTTRMVIDRFNEAFNRHDADALALLLTDDTVFEDTSPPPDGRRRALGLSQAAQRPAVAPPRRGRLHRARRESGREARLRKRVKAPRRC